MPVGEQRSPSQAEAATVIGRHARGAAARREARVMEKGAVALQSAVRGKQARKEARAHVTHNGHRFHVTTKLGRMRRKHRPTDFDEEGARLRDETRLGALFRYHRDGWIGHGTGQIQLLLCVFAALLVFGGLLSRAVDEGGVECRAKDADGAAVGEPVACGFADSVWLSWTFMNDMGTHADSGSTNAKRVAYFVMAIVGFLFFGVILGFVVDAVHATMGAMKEGKCAVVERDHILVLGWSDRVPTLLRELALACESDGGGVVVILAEQPKPQLEAEIANNFSTVDLRGLRIVLRSGTPSATKDLLTVSPDTARAIIVLTQQRADPCEEDTAVLRTVREGLAAAVVYAARSWTLCVSRLPQHAHDGQRRDADLPPPSPTFLPCPVLSIPPPCRCCS